MNAELLCAGLGTRFRPHTDRLAKPCLPFLNIPLIAYGLYYLEGLGLKNLVINTHHLPKSVQSVVECLTHKSSYKVQFSHEPKILGSGGGIKQAQALLAAKDDFIVGNGDEFMVFKHGDGLKPLLDFHKKNGALATLLTTDYPEAGKSLGGVWADKSGHITQLGGQSAQPGARHFTGYYVFSPRVFDYMPAGGEFHIFKDCLHKAMAAKEKVLSFHNPDILWLDMTSEKDYVRATARALSELHKDTPYAKNILSILRRFHQPLERVGEGQWLSTGATFKGIADPHSLVLLGPNAQIGDGVEVTGFAIVGANTRFSQGFIENAALAPNLQVNELTSLRNQLLI